MGKPVTWGQLLLLILFLEAVAFAAFFAAKWFT